MKKTTIDQVKKHTNLANFSENDKEDFFANCNFYWKNPKDDNIYSEELNKTINYFSNFYEIGPNYEYHCYGKGHYFPWHTDTHCNEIGSIIIPLNKDGQGICKTIYEDKIVTRTYIETIYLNTQARHKTTPSTSNYAHLRLPVVRIL